MQENKNTDELPEASVEQLEEFGSIFKDEDKVVEGLRKSAEAVGINPDAIISDDGKAPVQYYARKNCKRCCGRGVINMVPSPQKQKVRWANERKTGKFTKRKSKKFPQSRRRGPTPPRRKVITSFSPANEELTFLWDDREKSSGTRRPEPFDYKENTMRSYLCGCVRSEEAA